MTTQNLNRKRKNIIVSDKRDLVVELRGALMEVKDSIEGKRKLNTLDNLINELANEATKAAVEEACSGKNPNKVYDNVDDLFNALDSEISKNNV